MADQSNNNGQDQQEDYSWEEFIKSANNPKPDQPSPGNTNPVPGTFTHADILERWGFEQAIADVECPKDKLVKLLGDHQKRLEEKIDYWKNQYAAIKAGIDAKIELAKKDIESKQNKKSTFEQDLKSLKEQRDKVVKEMEGIRNRLYEVRRELSVAKQDMITKWMKEAEEEIKRAVEIQKMVYNETRPLSQRQYDDNKPALNIRIEQIKRTRDFYLERYTEVHKKLKLLGGDGINPFATYVLIAIGTSVAAAAGYFFSIFTYSANFGNQDLIYFLLDGFIRSSNAGSLHFLWKALYVFGGLLLVTGVSYLCYLLINKINSKPSKKEEVINHYLQGGFKQDGLQYFGQIKTRNWYILWLQILPVLLIIALVILVLSLNGTAANDINALNSSNEGILFGSAIAFGIGGIMYLYITKVIESRLQHKPEDANGIWNWFKYNWELGLSIFLFIICTSSIIYFNWTDTELISYNRLSVRATIVITTLEFISACFLSAFSFAYGLRLRGLMAIGHYLEREIKRTDDEIVMSSVPFMPGIYIDYSRKLQEIINDVLAVLQNKVLLLRGATENKPFVVKVPDEANKRKSLRDKIQDIIAAVQHVFSKKQQEAEDAFHKLSQLAEWESKYFPDHDERMKVINGEYKDKEKELKNNEVEMDRLKTKAENEELIQKAETENINRKIESWNVILNNAAGDIEVKIQAIRDSAKEDEMYIMRGFSLGLWARENQIGPVYNYYNSCIHFKMNGHANEPAK